MSIFLLQFLNYYNLIHVSSIKLVGKERVSRTLTLLAIFHEKKECYCDHMHNDTLIVYNLYKSFGYSNMNLFKLYNIVNIIAGLLCCKHYAKVMRCGILFLVSPVVVNYFLSTFFPLNVLKTVPLYKRHLKKPL